MDSGASINLIARKNLTKAEQQRMRKIISQILLSTANGTVAAEFEVDLYVSDLETTLTFLVLEDTPTVISLGGLCKNKKFTYLWEGDQEPTLTS